MDRGKATVEKRVASIAARRLADATAAVRSSKDGDALLLLERPPIVAEIVRRALEREKEVVAFARRRVLRFGVALVAAACTIALAPTVSDVIEADPESLDALLASLLFFAGLLWPPIALWRSRKCWRIALTGREFRPEHEWEYGEIQGIPRPAALYADRFETVSAGMIQTSRLHPGHQVRRTATRILVVDRQNAMVQSFEDPVVLDADGNATGIDPAEAIRDRIRRL